MELRPVAYADALGLADAMTAELATRYGGRGASPVDPSHFDPPGVFLVASVDGVDAACGGLRVLREGVGEVKRMYADPAHRGRGLARSVLRALVDHARAGGLQEVWLETGLKQPEAIALYESEGFTPVEAYGHFRDEPLSRCYGLRL